MAGMLGAATLLTGCDATASNSNASARSDYYTRGIGVYPGSPAEDPSPELVAGDGSYRNVAKWRAAYHSSSYDYNLTAQLLTDGILSSEQPATINVSTQAGDLLKNEREWLFDGKSDSQYRMSGDDIYLQLALNNFRVPADRIVLKGSVTFDDKVSKGLETVLSGSNDGESWVVIQEKSSQPTQLLNQTFTLTEAADYAFYHISLKMEGAKDWAFSDWDFYKGEELLLITPSQYFNSAWMSAGTGEEWVYVDLGVPTSFDQINLHWINKAVAGTVQVSDDAKVWADLAALPGGTERTDSLTLDKTAKARYVRILMTQSENNQPYLLSELEVQGKGGLVPRPQAVPAAKDNRLFLTAGNWKVQRASLVDASGKDISTTDFTGEAEWIPATVPGTVLTSYWRIGALPDPNYGDNQLQISESFFNSNFWYRDAFDVPADFSGERLFLNFDGINWKANIFLNGTEIGRINGGFMRGKFDVTELIAAGKTNVLAVEIIKNAHVGAVKEQTAFSADQNGGILGADNPTFHSTIGWDWIPTIRGRDIGIWNDVFLTHTGAVTIENPFIRAELPLPDTTSANIVVDVTLKNHTGKPVTGKLKGLYGTVSFEQEVSLAAAETQTITLDSAAHAALKLQNPTLWWPKGYGNQHLYDVELSFDISGSTSDKKNFKSGVRQMTFNEDNGILSLFINGRRFIGRGGNWGFGESNLNYRGREYDIAVAYHADMNFTMIRNWVGQIGDEEFYEACDHYGVMVWQDFWLANPYDGPVPDDNNLFMTNADDFVKRIRNHPSIALYVGRNEGNPPDTLDKDLRALLPALHPGIHYISHSAAGVVSGGGPYRALPPRDYYLLFGNNRFHSERGMPNVMTYESLAQTLPADKLWPQNSFWGLHDYTLGSAQSAATFNDIIEKAFGKAQDARQFTEWAQWVNYNGYRGIFEGRSEFRRGMLLWMSHPAWPSMVWQTYDYYFDPTAAYFGCKKGNEPLHIQWNPVWDNIEVVNYHARNHTALTAKAQLINMDGTVQWEKDTVVDSNEDSTVKAFKLDFPESLSPVYFIKLTLTENGTVVSDNFYWRGKEDGNYQALHQLPKVNLTTTTAAVQSGEEWLLTTTLKNETTTPAVMIRLKVSGSKTAGRILPVFFSDNFFSLMPGEEKTVTMRLQNADTRGEQPVADISGFNL